MILCVYTRYGFERNTMRQQFSDEFLAFLISLISDRRERRSEVDNVN